MNVSNTLVEFPYGYYAGKQLQDIPKEFLLNEYYEHHLEEYPTIKQWIEGNLI